MEVQIKRWGARGRELVVDSVKASSLNIFFDTIVLNAQRGLTQEPQQGDPHTLHIHIWSTPKKRGTVSLPNRVKGVELDSCVGGFLPSGLGRACYLGEEQALAEYLPGNLYIHFNLFSAGDPAELILFEMILAWLIEILAWQMPQASSSEELLLECFNACSGKVETQKELAQHEERLVQSLVSSSRQVERYQKALSGGEENTLGLAEEVFDSLWDTDGVQAVMLHGDTLYLYHEPITYRASDQSTRLLGAFRLIAPLGNNDRFVAKNLSCRPAGAQHPHYITSACLGGFSRSFVEATRAQDYLVSAQTALLFLESVQESDTLRSVMQWPYL